MNFILIFFIYCILLFILCCLFLYLRVSPSPHKSNNNSYSIIAPSINNCKCNPNDTLSSDGKTCNPQNVECTTNICPNFVRMPYPCFY